MNYLGIDYGQKNIGTAISIKGIITPLKIYPNSKYINTEITKIISDYQIEKIALGYTQSPNLKQIKKFKLFLEQLTGLEVILVEENLSTITAQEIVKSNLGYQKKYLPKPVDAVSAAVILSRLLV